MNSLNNKISVIIPTYNRSHIVDRAICSVLAQTYDNVEIMVIDDASRDNTREIVEGIKDKRIRYIAHRSNQGGAAARNTGIRASREKYLGFLDSDDIWMPDKLEKQMALFESQSGKVGVIYTGMSFISKENKILRSLFPETNGDIGHSIFYNNFVGSTSTVLVRRECFKECGIFDETLPSCQDWDMWIRIARKYNFACIKDPLVRYFIDGDRISTNMIAKVEGHRMILEKYFKDFENCKKYHAEQRLRIGMYLAFSGEQSKGRKEVLKAIFLHPYRLKYYLHLGCSFLGVNHYRALLKEQ